MKFKLWVHELRTKVPSLFTRFNKITTLSGPTIHYHTTTTAASAVVEPSLDNRAQPVATEYAVPPISTHTVLVTGM